MNISFIYDKNNYRKTLKNKYNENKFNFSKDDNMLNNIISNWKYKTYRFKKESVLYNKKDYKNRIILREYIFIESKKKFQELEFIICGNAENIIRMRLSHHYYIDATFHHSKRF